MTSMSWLMAYKEMSATTGSTFGICQLSPGLQSFGLQPLPPHGQSPAELLTCNKRNFNIDLFCWHKTGRGSFCCMKRREEIYIYICIFNNYMEKVGGWEKNHDVEAFSPVSRSRSTLTICLKVAKGPGWSRIVWPTSLSISLLAIGKGTPWKLIQHLEQSGPI